MKDENKEILFKDYMKFKIGFIIDHDLPNKQADDLRLIYKPIFDKMLKSLRM
ncbi:MAG TPA: hypothetical protein VMX17_01975 [Candidatus Glassbacteria bacterium]|nr:hypothetical protein [Candidatus Glassbacteria bacterium]